MRKAELLLSKAWEGCILDYAKNISASSRPCLPNILFSFIEKHVCGFLSQYKAMADILLLSVVNGTRRGPLNQWGIE